MKIDWKRIKNGYAGFENLAVDYVNDTQQCVGCKWKHTKKTRDSNHDAILVKENNDYSTLEFINTAIFVGYANNIDIWWMEAKYSSSAETKILPRYRLDATIVSAILSRNLKKVIFVTNLVIAEKTMYDIRKALVAGSSCEEVVFCTKNELETWLLNKDYDIFQTYFKYSELEFKNLSKHHIISNSGLTFFEPCENLFFDPQNIVYSGFLYEINFDINVFRKCTGKLITVTNLENESECIKKIELMPGTNHFKSMIRVTQNLQYESITKKDVLGECKPIVPPALVYEISNSEDDTIEKICILPNNTLEVIDSKFFNINIPSQEQLCAELYRDSQRALSDFNRKTTIFYINGKSGIGKSYILQQYKQLIDGEIQNCLCTTYTYTGDQSYDIGLIKKFLFNLFFPYLNYKEVDYCYIEELKTKADIFSNNYWNLVFSDTDIDTFMKSCGDKENIKKILPQNIKINKKIVIFDDLHKLDDKLFICLNNIIEYLAKCNYTIYCILVSQKAINNQKIYNPRNIKVISRELKVKNDDIVEIINERLNPIRVNHMDILFGSVIELVYFLKYLNDVYDTIKNYDDFRLAYNVFKNSDILRNEIEAKFRDTFRKHSEAEALCSCIYYIDSGISFEVIQNTDELKNVINVLLDAELVKKNNDDFYVPWHDYYREIYMSFFPLKECENISIPFKSVYDLKILLTLEKFNKKLIEDLLIELDKLYSEQKFYSIYYILENLFLEKNNRMKFKNHVTSEHYFVLFAYFCYANTNAGWKYSGYDKFYELYTESLNSKSYRVQSIHYIILWELINSLYEAGKFEEALEKIHLFNKISDSLKENWYYIFEWDLQSLITSVNSVNILINSEYGKNSLNEIETVDKLLLKDVSYTTYRIILSNLVNDFSKAKKMLYNYNCIIQADERFDKKSRYMYDFTVKFFECMDNVIDISEVIHANEKLKSEFLNDYNRHIYIIALLALIKKDIDLCEEYSCEYLKSSRPLKNRQLAFRQAYLALINFYNNNKAATIELLEKELAFLAEYKKYLPVVIHNINYVKKNQFNMDNISFYCGGSLSEDIYYIDIRMLY